MQLTISKSLAAIAAVAMLGGAQVMAQNGIAPLSSGSGYYEQPISRAMLVGYEDGGCGCDDGCGGCDACDACDDCCDCGCPLIGIGAGAGPTLQIDYLMWQMHSNNLDYAITETNEANRVGIGAVRYIDPDYEGGVRTRIGWVCPSGWEPAVSYTTFGTKSGDALQDTDSGRLHSTRLHIQNGDGVDIAAAAFAFDLSVWDLEIARRIVIGDSTAVRWFGGFRYADISQRFVTANAIGSSGFTRFSWESTNTDAYGLRAGVEGYWTTCCGFSLFGRMAGSVLTADRKYRFLETDTGSTPLEVALSDTNTDVLPVLEVSLGASYQHGPFEIACGYELANWFGLGQSLRFVEETPGYDEYPIRQRHDILLEGFFVRLGYYH